MSDIDDACVQCGSPCGVCECEYQDKEAGMSNIREAFEKFKRDLRHALNLRFHSDYYAGFQAGAAMQKEKDAKWELIDTAPKDGSYFLAGAYSEGGVWRYCVVTQNEMLWDWCWAFEPTHWMPLQEPPQENDKEGEG